TAQDGSGHTSIHLGSGSLHPAPDIPKPDLYNMDAHLMAAMEEMDAMEHGEDAEAEAEPERPLSPYSRLRAVRPTVFPSSLPRRFPLRSPPPHHRTASHRRHGTLHLALQRQNLRRRRRHPRQERRSPAPGAHQRHHDAPSPPPPRPLLPRPRRPGRPRPPQTH